MDTQSKEVFINELQALDIFGLYEACKKYIWLSAYAANNSHSDYHWQCDACYDECVRRNMVSGVYERAYRILEKNL